MDACTPSRPSLVVPLVAVAGTIAFAVATAHTAEPPAPLIDIALQMEPASTPMPPPPCEHWALDLSLRAAMQTCSMFADLDTNERWLFGVRAEIEGHRMVDMTITSIDHECAYCFDREADGREDRARITLANVTACMRGQLEAATFTDDTCTLDTRWMIQNDW